MLYPSPIPYASAWAQYHFGLMFFVCPPRGLQPVPDEEVIDLYGGTQHIPLYQMSGFYGKVLALLLPRATHSVISLWGLAPWPTPSWASPEPQAAPSTSIPRQIRNPWSPELRVVVLVGLLRRWPPPQGPSIKQFMDIFSLPEMALLSCVVDHFLGHGLEFDQEHLYKDVTVRILGLLGVAGQVQSSHSRAGPPSPHCTLTVSPPPPGCHSRCAREGPHVPVD